MTSSRRTQMLDAAVDILAWQGSRALTHRAIDRRLSLPLGSAANYFQTRDALLRGIAERVIELDFASFGPIPEERVGRAFVAESIAAMILASLGLRLVSLGAEAAARSCPDLDTLSGHTVGLPD